MKWFKRKSESKSKSQSPFDYIGQHNGKDEYPPPMSIYGTNSPTAATARLGLIAAKLPPPILQRIFAFVCPHTQDETYETCEQSAIEDRCMLCDLRDLSHCAQVSRRWRQIAATVLYRSIRIDAVHYCELEDELAEKRKRGSFMQRNVEPEDTAQVRLKFLQRTLRDNLSLAQAVQFLKTPYMTRETCKPDLARCAAVCPNLRYLDLPEGIFTDDMSCNTLKQEIQRRCPDLRKMTYMGGSERSLEMLGDGTLWRNLEVLELSKLSMDTVILRRGLGALPQLRALKVTDMKAFQESVFQRNDYLPPFPALSELVFENTPNVTATGLADYLSNPSVQKSLRTLSLTETGVHPSTLHRIVSIASALENLSIVESVLTSFPAIGSVPLLQSGSLKSLHYEITSGLSANSYASVTASYYSYLTTSLMSGGLPNLLELFVRDHDFPETLLNLTPKKLGLMPANPRFSSNNPFVKMQTGLELTHPLQVYSKGLDEMDWNFSHTTPLSPTGYRGSATPASPMSSHFLSPSYARPKSSTSTHSFSPEVFGTSVKSPYGLSPPENLAKWGNGARRSLIVGNGSGGFLAVLDDDGRPSTSSGESVVRKGGSQYDMWR